MDTYQFSFVWRGIRKLCVLDRKTWDCFQSSISFSIGDGSLTSLWLDPWCNNQCLADRFPRLLLLASDPSIMVNVVRTDFNLLV